MRSVWVATLVTGILGVSGALVSAMADETPPEKSYKVTVLDVTETTHELRDATCYYAKSGLFGEGGEAASEFRVRSGSAEITVPFDRIQAVQFGPVDEGQDPWVGIWITLLPVEGEGENFPLEGKVRGGVELRGRNRYGDYRLRLADLKSVTFE